MHHYYPRPLISDNCSLPYRRRQGYTVLSLHCSVPLAHLHPGRALFQTTQGRYLSDPAWYVLYQAHSRIWSHRSHVQLHALSDEPPRRIFPERYLPRQWHNVLQRRHLSISDIRWTPVLPHRTSLCCDRTSPYYSESCMNRRRPWEYQVVPWEIPTGPVGIRCQSVTRHLHWPAMDSRILPSSRRLCFPGCVLSPRTPDLEGSGPQQNSHLISTLPQDSWSPYRSHLCASISHR